MKPSGKNASQQQAESGREAEPTVYLRDGFELDRKPPKCAYVAGSKVLDPEPPGSQHITPGKIGQVPVRLPAPAHLGDARVNHIRHVVSEGSTIAQSEFRSRLNVSVIVDGKPKGPFRISRAIE